MAEEEVKRHSNVKRIVKAKLARQRQFIERFEVTTSNVYELEIRLEAINEYLVEFKQSSEELFMSFVEDKDLEETANELINFEEDWYKLKANFLQAINKVKVNPESATATAPVLVMQQQPVFNAKLPDFQLPKFDGNVENFPEFKDAFTAMVDKLTIPNVEKFMYLVNSCKGGDAESFLKTYQILDENYPIAWNDLCERYNNQRLIADKHFAELLKCRAINSPHDLAKVVNCYSIHIKQLEQVINDKSKLWDLLVIHMATWRLDDDTRRAWEIHLKRNELPTWEKLEKFLQERVRVQEQLQHSSRPPSKPSYQRINKVNQTTTFVTTENNLVCPICEHDHVTFKCREFNKLCVGDRRIKVREKELCFNCLQPGHTANKCPSRNTCKECNAKHHTLVHEVKPEIEEAQENEVQTFVTRITKPRQVLLATAIIQVENLYGELVPCRVVLDTASESNLITEAFAQTLRIKKSTFHVNLRGVNQDSKPIRSMMTVKIKSRTSKYNNTLDCLVVSSLSKIPSQELHVELPEVMPGIELADPNFFSSERIDILIGAEIILDLIKDGKQTIIKDKLFARDSEFGWLMYGKLESESPKTNINCFVTTQTELLEQLKKFWEIETIAKCPQYTTEENHCEELFVSTTSRDNAGRFIVTLPTKNNVMELKSNRSTAIRRLYVMEKRLDENPEHRKMYNEFMAEYQKLGHMKKITTEKDADYPVVHYLPHHPVFKPTSTTTKLRVVFNASCKDTNGLTLNNTLCVGPKVQQELFQILLRFCQFPLVVIADVQMMYRQTLVDPKQTHMQRIVWREKPFGKIQDYALQTITYGTAPASYLATRCLKELATQNREIHPEACDIIEHDFYMDDLVTGFDNVQQGIAIQAQIIEILESAKYHLRKWMSNCPQLLQNIDQSDREIVDLLDMYASVKTLGLYWNPNTDELSYNVNEDNPEITLTKRTVLSNMAKWFDPLGRINPVIVTAKIFMQQLFVMKLDWDEPLPPATQTKWKQFTSELSELNNITLPRYCLISNPIYIELHGFSDASESAYGACVYVLSRNEKNETRISLLCAKSRIATIQKVLLPRLELLGALLLAELQQKVRQSLRLMINRTILWTDSTIVLYWLRMEEGRLKLFVLNQVQKIKELTDDCVWRHVPTKQNPADHVSRGMTPSALCNESMWWNGPSFLLIPENDWPNKLFEPPSEIPEQKATRTVLTVTALQSTILNDCSSLSKIKRIFGYVTRFINNTRNKKNRQLGPLTHDELQNGFLMAIRTVQLERFSREVKSLIAGENVDNKSSIKSLNVFLGTDNILRVGGRLQNADLGYDQKHPMLLPNHHNFTKVIVRDFHVLNLHCGENSLIASIRLQFWPIRCRNLVKQVIRECLSCATMMAKPAQQLMGNLPSYRVTLEHPFHHTGVDYAGPINIRAGTSRSRTVIKSWIAVFVCMSTKAAHLELVTGLSTEAFLTALDRFIGRRGIPGHMHSDQGTNFMGAKVELKSDHKYENIQWHQIPAHSPNFGGLWESTVKLVKRHLTRVIGEQLCDYEELSTILCRIEAIINSRPLTPLSDDPNDLSALTPAHFLVGRSLNARPQRDATGIPINRLKRFQLMQRISQDFWKRFYVEYLQCLQQRKKWFFKADCIKPGTLVLVKDDNAPPMKWPMGRIEKVFPGKDGLNRVALVRTSKGVYDRGISKLCPLFVETSFQPLQDV